MYFDGASEGLKTTLGDNTDKSAGIGIIFITLDNGVIMHLLTLSSGCSNNETKYEALITGFKPALKIPIDDIIIYRDSKLVIHQMNGLYHIKKPSLTLYFKRAKDLAKLFWHLKI